MRFLLLLLEKRVMAKFYIYAIEHQASLAHTEAVPLKAFRRKLTEISREWKKGLNKKSNSHKNLLVGHLGKVLKK